MPSGRSGLKGLHPGAQGLNTSHASDTACFMPGQSVATMARVNRANVLSVCPNKQDCTNLETIHHIQKGRSKLPELAWKNLQSFYQPFFTLGIMHQELPKRDRTGGIGGYVSSENCCLPVCCTLRLGRLGLKESGFTAGVQGLCRDSNTVSAMFNICFYALADTALG